MSDKPEANGSFANQQGARTIPARIAYDRWLLQSDEEVSEQLRETNEEQDK